jgi:protease I
MSNPPQHRLGGMTVAILSNTGFEQAELFEPRDALREMGVETRIVSVSPGKIQGFHHEQPGDWVDVDLTLDKADPGAFDAVLLPGGVQNADKLRTSHSAQDFVRAMDEAGKPVAVICHGPWLLVSAGLVEGRTLTSWPSLQDDIRNAGGKWVDREVVVDGNWVSSRKPADIPAFNEKVKEVLAESRKKTLVGTADDVPSSPGVGG